MSTKKIRYQVLTPEYVEGTIQCSIACKSETGNTYSDFNIPVNYVEKQVRQQLATDISYKFTIIAIDQSIGNKVVGIVQGMDVMDYDRLVKAEQSHPRLDVLAKLSNRLTEDPRSQIKKYGECIYGNSMGVLPEYRSNNMSIEILKMFTRRCYQLGYKQYIGLIYNPKMKQLLDKVNIQVISELNPDDCLDLDPNIKQYFNRKYISVIYIFDETATLAKRYSQQKQYFLEQFKLQL